MDNTREQPFSVTVSRFRVDRPAGGDHNGYYETDVSWLRER